MDIKDSFNNISDSTVTVHLTEHKTPPQLTSKLGKDTIIGRAKELQEIDTLLKKSSSLLLINGIGGIGKSTIASYYLHSQKENLEYYGFFEGLDSFTTELREPLALKQEKENDAFMEALSKLRKLEGNKLLVFDDVKEIGENQDKIEKILALKNSGYKILLTSREEIEDVEQYYLDVLSLSDAKELFNSIYKVEDEVLLEEILEYLDCHAFFVEMTAKTLKSKKTLTPEIIKEKFENGEFSTIKRKRKESFNDYLNELFSFDELDNEEILVLKQFSVLPSIKIEFAFLQEIFNKQYDEEFEDILNFLCEKGWLSSFENGYKLHQIIKEYIHSFQIPNFEEIEPLFNTMSIFIEKSADIEISAHNEKYIKYMINLNKILEVIDVEDKKVVDFFTNLGHIYHYSGYFKQAEPLLEKLVKIHENTFGKKHLSTAISYNNLAQNYKLLGKYDKARIYHYQALRIRQDMLGEYHLHTAESYHNIAGIFQNTDESEELYRKALKIREAIVEKEHPIIASSYNGLGELYKHEKKYKKALSFHRNALKIRKQKLGETHPYTILSYHNLATVFLFLRKFKKAQKLFKKGLSINIEERDKDFYGTEIFKSNLAKSENNDKNTHFIVIDEPELCLHPMWTSKMINTLNKENNHCIKYKEKYNKRENFKK